MPAAPIPPITDEQLDRLLRGEYPDPATPTVFKLMQLPDGRMVKVFPRGAIWSSRWWRPAAVQFVSAAQELERLGVPTVSVLQRVAVGRLKRDVVIYAPLAGETLRDAMENAQQAPALFDRYAAFLAELHQKGVFFRGIHFGNIIVTPNGAMGLVDLAPARFYGRPLSVAKRVRNLAHIIDNRLDRQRVQELGQERLIESYLDASSLSGAQSAALRTRTARIHSSA